MGELLLRTADARGVATLTLNRPEVHNAFDDALIRVLSETLAELGSDDRVRVVVLTGAGRSFCAGADLAWMRQAADYDHGSNVRDARALSLMLEAFDSLPKPSVVRIQGAAMGGGAGLVAAADIAVAGERARFAFSEVRVGLIPAVISPFVIRAIGARAARRLFLTGERFPASEALRVGLVHEVVPDDALDDAVERVVADLLLGGPEAQREVKHLVRDVAGAPPDSTLYEETAQRIAARRASVEGREGLSAFLQKRLPGWRGL